jgi:hypothetical protein
LLDNYMAIDSDRGLPGRRLRRAVKNPAQAWSTQRRIAIALAAAAVLIPATAL